MAGKYIIDTGGVAKPDFQAYQTFHHRFATDRTHNETITVHWFVDELPSRREWFNEVMIFLSKFQFATKKQIEAFLLLRGLDTSKLEENLTEMLSRRLLNCFFLSEEAEDPSEGANFPDDAYVVYCLDLCAKQLLIHFYRDDFVYWRINDCYRNTEQVLKYLSTCQFYISLLTVKSDHLLYFTSVYDASIGRRLSRYSGIFEVSDGSATPRKFILESIRSFDLPAFWDKKVSEQIFPLIDRGYWKQSFQTTPYFVLLADDMSTAEQASSILFRRLPKLKFCVTTDAEVLKGLAEAEFYRYTATNPEDISQGGALTPVKASIFTKYTS